MLALMTTGVGCGGGKVEPPRGDTPPGAQCSSDAECQSGLSCTDQGVCVYDRCNNAPDPDMWCAGQLSVTPERATCERGSGQCQLVQGLRGESCQADEGCIFGLVCEQGSCVDTCTSSASCRGEDESCLPRTQGASTKICQDSPDCTMQTSPREFCALEFGLEVGEVECRPDGQCVPVRYGEGVSCRFDDQCATSICEQGFCVTSCQDDSECFGELVCRPRLGDRDQRVCQALTCLESDNPDLFCEELLGERAECTVFGSCEVLDEVLGVFVMIEDTSTGGACESEIDEVHDPGIDLMYIGAYGDGTETAGAQGYALPDVLYAEQGMLTQENTLVTYEHLEEVLLQGRFDMETGCLLDVKSLEPGSVYSMGCGGRMVFSFNGSDGEPVRLTRSSEIVIGEFEPVCTGRNSRPRTDETFSISICTDTNAVANQRDFSSCTLELEQENYEALTFAYYFE